MFYFKAVISFHGALAERKSTSVALVEILAHESSLRPTSCNLQIKIGLRLKLVKLQDFNSLVNCASSIGPQRASLNFPFEHKK